MNMNDERSLDDYEGADLAKLCFSELFNHTQGDLSVVMLRQISVLIHTMGTSLFVQNFIGLKQQILIKPNSKIKPMHNLDQAK
jgi:hypothetical protein